MTVPARLAPAYAACARLARAHYENFPVASRLLPHTLRPHVAAIYAFARTADDFADEGSAPPELRLARLEEWRERVWAAAAARRVPSDAFTPLFDALGYTIASHGLPVPLFEQLLSAFGQDVVTTRYQTWTDVLDYCRRSANPVGRLVLRLAGHHAEETARASDRVCTALQLANFWQDFAVDWARGRLYLPAEESRRWGAEEAALDPSALSPEWRRALEAAVARTRGLFDEGRDVTDRVAGRLRYQLRLTWLGGVRILDKLAATGYDPFHHRPTLGVGDVPALAWGALRWRTRR